jgi:thiol-disulfide isomerase/thioredoxin
MSTKVDCTLYYADWCTHCVNFKPEWEKLKQKIKQSNGKYNDISLTIAEYESKQIPNNTKINGKDIQGFPTIKVSVNKNGIIKEFDYNGKRNSDALFYYMSQGVLKHV